MSFILEIAVESVDAAKAAERAGADRIELCAKLSVGGLTCSQPMMSEARQSLQIPIFAMIRPRPGNFIYDEADFGTMKSQIALAREMKMDGVVLGILTPQNTIDIMRTKELVEIANPMLVTFHRAFDATPDQLQALNDVIATGAQRILTSGGAPSAPQGVRTLRDLLASAGQRIVVMPGAGIHAGNFSNVRRLTGAQEFHSGLGTVMPYGNRDYSLFEKEIRQIVAQKTQPSD